jgi:hypothetical protein
MDSKKRGALGNKIARETRALRWIEYIIYSVCARIKYSIRYVCNRTLYTYIYNNTRGSMRVKN